jgi:N-succinyl-L-ornithine transcarbamylase
MKLFSSVNDVTDINALVKPKHYNLNKIHMPTSIWVKIKPWHCFLNPSLRTRMSTQKAALNLGMNVMVLNIDKEGWALELRDNVIMNGTTVEHIREAAGVMGSMQILSVYVHSRT